MQETYPRPREVAERLNPHQRNSLRKADSAELRRAAAGLRRVTTELQVARIGRAVLAEYPLDEVMTECRLDQVAVFAEVVERHLVRGARRSDRASLGGGAEAAMFPRVASAEWLGVFG